MIIGFSGRIGVGKTEMAKGIQERITGSSIRSFATHLKECVKFTFGLTDWHVNTSEGKKYFIQEINMTVRKVLQRFGTDFGRDMIHPDFWIMIESHIISKLEHKDNIIYDDVRFENEADFIHQNKGIIIHLFRDNAEVHNVSQSEKSHASETELRASSLDICIELPNDIEKSINLIMHELRTYSKDIING